MTEQDKRWQIHRHLAQDTDERLQLVRNAPKRIMLIGADARHQPQPAGRALSRRRV